MNRSRIWILIIVLLALASAACVCTGSTDFMSLVEELAPTEDYGIEVEIPTIEVPTLDLNLEEDPVEPTPPPPPPPADDEPGNTAVGEVGLPYSTSFDSVEAIWEEGSFDTGDVGFTGTGAYFVTASENGLMMWGVGNVYHTDALISATARQVSAPANDNNGYGVMCRVQPNSDGYLFRISGDGFYSIFVVVDGEFTPLVDWTTSGVINQGNTTNIMQAGCVGNTLTLRVNGVEVTSAVDSTYFDGYVAVGATTYEDNSFTEVHFEELSVTAP